MIDRRDDSPKDRARVYEKIAPLILAFAEMRAGDRFQADELLRFIRTRDRTIAPDSPGRILRLLREKGKLDYVVIDRARSTYQFRRKPKE